MLDPTNKRRHGMASYVQLGEVRTYYEEDGSGAPLVLLHPGGADSRAFEVNLPGLVDRFRVFRPDRRGHGRTPDVDGPIDLDDETTAFFTEYHGAVSPDGPEHFPVIAAKLHRMHSEEPTLTVADLAGYPGPTLVMVGDDDDEIPMEHTLALRQGLPRVADVFDQAMVTGPQLFSTPECKAIEAGQPRAASRRAERGPLSTDAIRRW